MIPSELDIEFVQTYKQIFRGRYHFPLLMATSILSSLDVKEVRQVLNFSQE